jgi:arylsulfatase A-like enzyme
LDKIASQGVRFTNANVVFSLCSPSRAALLTGRYGSSNGVLHLSSNLNEGEKTVATYLQEVGYQTAISGKWHIGQSPENVGFDFHVYFEGNGSYYNRLIHDMGKEIKPEIHCDEYCVTRSIDFLKEASKSGKPFFLYHNTQLPHMNGELVWDAKTETKEMYNQAELPVALSRNDNLSEKPEYLKTVRNRTQSLIYGYPDSVAIQNHTLDYYSVITEMDHALERLFNTLDELNLWENTYVFFMGDNGWMLGEHGFTSKVLPYRPSTHVPFFVVGPELKKDENSGLVLNIDIAPTILELAGIEVPDNMHGKSVVQLLSNDMAQWRNSFIYEGLGNYGGTKPNLTAINNNFRYIETYEDSTLNNVVFRELYNQLEDADEMVNLANIPSSEMLLKKMQEVIRMHKLNILRLPN